MLRACDDLHSEAVTARRRPQAALFSHPSLGAATVRDQIPLATDTAFAIALVVMMGPRVPVELRIFLTAAAIVDDIGAIVVVAAFYSGDVHMGYLPAAAAVAGSLALLSRSRVYVLAPYVVLGVALWALVYAAGLHATLAGIVLALFIPNRPPTDLAALMAQANTIITSEARHEGDILRHGPRRRRCARSTRSTTASSHQRTGCCAAPAQGRATWSCRFSR